MELRERMLSSDQNIVEKDTVLKRAPSVRLWWTNEEKREGRSH
jgi:hypothetical protein